MLYRLGKRPARPGSIQLKFGSYFTAAELPTVPDVFGRPWLVRNFGMLGNDQYGDCVWAGAAHETMLLRADAGVDVPPFTDAIVLSDYAAATGFNAADPSTDQGTDVQSAAAYRQKTGVLDANGVRHKIDIYTSLRVGDLDELALATFLFGAAGIGVSLPSSAEEQFIRAEVWDNVPGDNSVGGHYINCVGRNSLGNYLFVSWGRLQAATPAWVHQNMDEGLAFVSLERLRSSGLSPQGFNEPALLGDFRTVTA